MHFPIFKTVKFDIWNDSALFDSLSTPNGVPGTVFWVWLARNLILPNQVNAVVVNDTGRASGEVVTKNQCSVSCLITVVQNQESFRSTIPASMQVTSRKGQRSNNILYWKFDPVEGVLNTHNKFSQI